MRKRITPSMVVSIVALVFSTTGSAFAAKTLIDGGDIKNGSITSADIKDGSLSGRDIEAGSVELDRLTDGTEPSSDDQAGEREDDAAAARDEKRAKRAKGDAAHIVKSLVPFATGEATARSDEWRAYEGNLGIAPAIDDEGIAFGPFVQGEEWNSAYTYALKGARLADVARIAYSTRYTGGGGPGAVPYLVVLTESGHRVTFTPNTQPAVTPEEDAWQRWVVTEGTVRYDEDSAGADVPWVSLLADHGDETIDSLSVQAGNAGAMSAGSTSHVRNVTMEVTGAAPAVASYSFRS
jgi:hypothetical protein